MRYLTMIAIAVAPAMESVSGFDLGGLSSYGALGICLAYFIYKDNKTNASLKASHEESSRQLTEVITRLDRSIAILTERMKVRTNEQTSIL